MSWSTGNENAINILIPVTIPHTRIKNNFDKNLETILFLKAIIIVFI